MNINEINKQLELLETTKLRIRESLKNQGAEIATDTAFSDYAEQIDNLPVLDTYDADATNEDLILNKTAYVQGNKVTGTIPLNREFAKTVTGSGITQTDSVVKFETTLDKKIAYDINSPMSISTTPRTLASVLGLTANKLKENTTILGISGTVHEGISTDDANATSLDIVENKTAYVNDRKLTGILTKYDSHNPYMFGVTNASASYIDSYGKVDIINYQTDANIYAIKSNYLDPNGKNTMIKIPRAYIEKITNGQDYALRIFTFNTAETKLRCNIIVGPAGTASFKLSRHEGTYSIFALDSNENILESAKCYYALYNEISDLENVEWKEVSSYYDAGISNQENGHIYTTLPAIYYQSGDTKSDINLVINPKIYKYMNRFTPGNTDKGTTGIALIDNAEIYMPINIENIVKAEQIEPHNIREGVEILGVHGTMQEGIDTTDATATADKILVGYSAYVKDQKIEGTFEPQTERLEELERTVASQKAVIEQQTAMMEAQKQTIDTQAQTIANQEQTIARLQEEVNKGDVQLDSLIKKTNTILGGDEANA